MTTLPRVFSSLTSQVAAALREEIDRSTWAEWLPGERTLTETLQVSRKTLRKALAQLQREGRVRAVHGQGNQIVRCAGATTSGNRGESVVALLTPDPLQNMRPYTSLWVNHLKTLLIEKGARLRAFDGRKFFTQHPARVLEKLLAQQPAGCWLLANSTEAVQRWFAGQAVPCVVAGPAIPASTCRMPTWTIMRSAGMPRASCWVPATGASLCLMNAPAAPATSRVRPVSSQACASRRTAMPSRWSSTTSTRQPAWGRSCNACWKCRTRRPRCCYRTGPVTSP